MNLHISRDWAGVYGVYRRFEFPSWEYLSPKKKERVRRKSLPKVKANDFVTLSNAAFVAAYRIADGYAAFLAVRTAENDILFTSHAYQFVL
jgi:hypothetical protein